MSEQREQAYSEIANRNSLATAQKLSEVEFELKDRIIHLENLVGTLSNKLNTLDYKYNLMLSEKFNGGSTAE